MSSIAEKSKKFYITTPIYYVNADPHIGSAYTTVAADVLARYHRMIGDEVFFLTGTDEHGAKIEEKAKEVGMEPQKFVDEIAAKFEFAWDELNISNDNFIRTTDSKHKKAVQKALKYLYDKGDVYKDTYEGLYCVGCEQYKSKKDLVDGKCPDHDKEPEKMSEECYMFRLSKYADQVREKIEKDEYKIRPIERKNEILSFYKEGLKDIAFSRKKVKWGIPLPWDKNHTNHTAYVWADAFLNYLTGLGWDGTVGITPKFWQADVHLTSKDILRVHATIWPAMLLALGLKLPKQLFIHGFFMVDGQKMSKSLGNVIKPSDLVKKYGVDGTRYLLMSATPFGHDGNVGWDKFDEKYNADLANGLGNLVARTLSMTEKYFDGKVPSRNKENKVFIPTKIEIRHRIKGSKLSRKFDNFVNIELKHQQKCIKKIEINEIIFRVVNYISMLDKYITEYKPFKLIKKDKEKTAAILYNCLESIRIIAWMILPFMPETSEKIYSQLGLNLNEEMQAKNYDFKKVTEWGRLKPGVKIKKGESLFPRLN